MTHLLGCVVLQVYPELVSDVAVGWWDGTVSDNNVNTKLWPDGTFRVHNCVLVWCRTENWNNILSFWQCICPRRDGGEAVKQPLVICSMGMLHYQPDVKSMKSSMWHVQWIYKVACFHMNHPISKKWYTVTRLMWLMLTSESDWKVIWVVECENLLVSALIFKIKGDWWWIYKHWDLHNAWLHTTPHTCNKYLFITDRQHRNPENS